MVEVMLVRVMTQVLVLMVAVVIEVIVVSVVVVAVHCSSSSNRSTTIIILIMIVTVPRREYERNYGFFLNVFSLLNGSMLLLQNDALSFICLITTLQDTETFYDYLILVYSLRRSLS